MNTLTTLYHFIASLLLGEQVSYQITSTAKITIHEPHEYFGSTTREFYLEVDGISVELPEVEEDKILAIVEFAEYEEREGHLAIIEELLGHPEHCFLQEAVFKETHSLSCTGDEAVALCTALPEIIETLNLEERGPRGEWYCDEAYQQVENILVWQALSSVHCEPYDTYPSTISAFLEESKRYGLEHLFEGIEAIDKETDIDVAHYFEFLDEYIIAAAEEDADADTLYLELVSIAEAVENGIIHAETGIAAAERIAEANGAYQAIIDSAEAIADMKALL